MPFAKARPALTALADTGEPSVGIRMCLNMSAPLRAPARTKQYEPPDRRTVDLGQTREELPRNCSEGRRNSRVTIRSRPGARARPRVVQKPLQPGETPPRAFGPT